MPEAPTTQAQKFEREKNQQIQQPPPPFPSLPEEFIRIFSPDVRTALRAYNEETRDWVQKYVQSLY